MINEARAREGLRDFLGLDGEQLDGLLEHLKTQKPAEVRAYLGALLPDTPPIRDFIAQVVGDASKSRGASGASEAPKESKAAKSKDGAKATKSNKATKAKAKSSSAKSAAAAAPPQPPSRTAAEMAEFEKRKRNRRIITGNEEKRRDAVVQNCLECGMIYYTEEYAKLSRCVYCDDPLGKGQARRAQDRQQTQDEAFSRALAHRDKLLDFDTSSAARTKVYDDQSDYFEMDLDVMDSKWATSAEKADMQARVQAHKDAEEEASRKIHLTLDIAGRRVVQQDASLRGTAAGAVYDSISAALARS
ncbi:Activating signal cointegrator 1 [Hondaea fermentalgiana]|uniref:Activating signal cointegrator 1 n=1 Tax=Hondaea fermentalgiana TaxID=2315210 RepID=A0A2R5G1I8_9STRA|nr:Activating signal cointegrator 1 [Hondaea fermentalgiana]|eukprot:GBG24887.1 Activating signal cointegrator 1 [Hondaea fermentalgiana]